MEKSVKYWRMEFNDGRVEYFISTKMGSDDANFKLLLDQNIKECGYQLSDLKMVSEIDKKTYKEYCE